MSDNLIAVLQTYFLTLTQNPQIENNRDRLISDYLPDRAFCTANFFPPKLLQLRDCGSELVNLMGSFQNAQIMHFICAYVREETCCLSKTEEIGIQLTFFSSIAICTDFTNKVKSMKG